MNKHSFTDALLKEVLNNKRNHYADNFDPMMEFDSCYRKAQSSRLFDKIADKIIPVGYQLNIHRRLVDILYPSKFYKSIIKSLNEMSLLYELLNDTASKTLLLKILAYKILGHEKVKLPRNNAKYWENIRGMKKLEVGHGNLEISFLNLNLLFLDLAPLGYKINVNATHAGAAAIFAQKQYEYEAYNFIIKANKGDIVLDCGACWGETSLYFSHEVGENGKVYSFEFIPQNIDIFNKNINYNPHLKRNIELIKHPVWNISDESLVYSDHGPGSSVSEIAYNKPNSQVCKTVSIDDFVERNNIPRIDFIKMDIEGAEIKALIGAKNTLKKYRPKLALSVYHKPDDFITIPEFLKNLNLDYEFYLDHHTIHFWETVLYAIPSTKKIYHSNNGETLGFPVDSSVDCQKAI